MAWFCFPCSSFLKKSRKKRQLSPKRYRPRGAEVEQRGRIEVGVLVLRKALLTPRLNRPTFFDGWLAAWLPSYASQNWAPQLSLLLRKSARSLTRATLEYALPQLSLLRSSRCAALELGRHNSSRARGRRRLVRRGRVRQSLALTQPVILKARSSFAHFCVAKMRVRPPTTKLVPSFVRQLKNRQRRLALPQLELRSR